MSRRMLIFDVKSSEKSFFTEDSDYFREYDIDFFHEPLNEQTLNNISDDDKEKTEIISVFVSSDITKKVLEDFKNLKVIASRSTGIDHIDVEECNRRGIKVFNVKNYGETTVVQFTFGLILALVRKIVPGANDVKKLQISNDKYTGRDLGSMTIGIIGTGAIGCGMCKIAHAFSMKILAYDFEKNEEMIDKYNVNYVELKELLNKSDIITLHIPYTEKNYHFISQNEFEMMKPNAYLINTARGELIDIKALYEAIVNKKLKGVALDVTECENISFYTEDFAKTISKTTTNCMESALLIQKITELDNVIVTPHIAYDTAEAVASILESTFKNINEYFLFN